MNFRIQISQLSKYNIKAHNLEVNNLNFNEMIYFVKHWLLDF